MQPPVRLRQLDDVRERRPRRRRQVFQRRRGLQAGPQHPPGEVAEPTVEGQLERAGPGADARHRRNGGRETLVAQPAAEHDGEVVTGRVHPAQGGSLVAPRRQRLAQRRRDRAGQLDGDEAGHVRSGRPAGAARSPAPSTRRRPGSRRAPRQAAGGRRCRAVGQGHPTQVKPTGRPPCRAGPATPTTPSPTPAPRRSRAPAASAAAVGSATGPAASSRPRSTPASALWVSVAYVVSPPRNHSLAPTTVTRRAPTPPPVIDSADREGEPQPLQLAGDGPLDALVVDAGHVRAEHRQQLGDDRVGRRERVSSGAGLGGDPHPGLPA